MNEQQERIRVLDNKGWYRFLKVLFFVLLAGVLHFNVSSIYLNYKPHKVLVADDTNPENIICKNVSKQIAISKIPGDFNTSEFNKNARMFCAGLPIVEGSTGVFYDGTDITNDILNKGSYRIEYGEKEITEGSWANVIKYSSLAIFNTLLVFEVIRRAFLYIVARVNTFYLPGWLKKQNS